MKLIDKDRITAEIERLKGQLVRGACASQVSMETNCKVEAYNEVLSILEDAEVKDSGLYEEQSVCLDAITSWSISENFGIMAEECGEMLSAINKLLRGRANPEDVITELADVSLVITAFATYLGYDKYLSEKARKLQRLKKRLEDWHEKVLLNRNTNQK